MIIWEDAKVPQRITLGTSMLFFGRSAKVILQAKLYGNQLHPYICCTQIHFSGNVPEQFCTYLTICLQCICWIRIHTMNLHLFVVLPNCNHYLFWTFHCNWQPSFVYFNSVTGICRLLQQIKKQ